MRQPYWTLESQSPTHRLVHITKCADRLTRDVGHTPEIGLEDYAHNVVWGAPDLRDCTSGSIVIHDIDSSEVLDSPCKCSMNIRWGGDVEFDDQQRVRRIFCGESGERLQPPECRDDLLALLQDMDDDCIAEACRCPGDWWEASKFYLEFAPNL